MINSTSPFNTGSYLRITGPTGTSVNKFVVYDYTPGKSFSMKFIFRLGDNNGTNTAASGTMFYFVGDGISYFNNVGFTSAQVFTGIQFIFGASGSITANYRNGSGPHLRVLQFNRVRIL